MAEPEVVNTPVQESPVPVAAEPQTTTTPAEDDVTTWKKRLAGKDQALTSAKAELDVARKEAEDLKRWKAETENANLSEFQKAQNRLAALEGELNEAREVARGERLKSAYPNYAQFLADTAGLSDEARAASFEKYMANLRKEQSKEGTDIFVEPNNPRKSGVHNDGKRSQTDIVSDMEKLGNPFV